MKGKNNAGFTLVELLVVMVVFGILISIAYPSYRTYLLRAHRTDARAALALDQSILERCYAQNFSYSANCASLPAFPHNSANGFYNLAISNLTASTFTLTATAIGTQVLDTSCTNFMVNQTGLQTASDSSGGAQTTCWTR